jgi:hypothetical protein
MHTTHHHSTQHKSTSPVTSDASSSLTTSTGSHSHASRNHPRRRQSSFRSKLKMVGGILLLLFLVVGGIAGYYLSQQTQDIRQEASGVASGPFTENFGGGTPPGVSANWVTNESSTWGLPDWGKNNGNFRVITPKSLFPDFPNPPAAYVTTKYLELSGHHGDAKPNSRFAVCRNFPANTFQSGVNYRFTTYVYMPNNSAPSSDGGAVGILSDGRRSNNSVAIQRWAQTDLSGPKRQWSQLTFDINYPAEVAVGENNKVNFCYYVNKNQSAIFSGFKYQAL